MPGTVVRDALAPDLGEGITWTTAAGIQEGPVWDALWPREIQFYFEAGTAAGTDPRAVIDILGADNEAFDENVVSIGRFGSDVVTTGAVRQLGSIYVDKRYVRARVEVTGTSGDVGNATLTPVLPHDRRVRATTTA